MLDLVKPSENLKVFVESTNTDELRAQRIWRFVVVLWMTWFFFAGFLCYRGYMDAARICMFESGLLIVINYLSKQNRNYRRVMNLNLAASAFGLFSVSVSHPAMHGTMLFYPVAILVASQLLGVRAALSWFLINLLAFTAFFVYVYGLSGSIYTERFDELVLVLGVAACVYFCCHQGEEYYRKRTQNLIQLSQDLQEKSDVLQELATTDSLTGLTNRFQFQEILADATRATANGGDPVALFLIDMDGFKEINDTLGHTVGDEALVEIAKRLESQFRGRAEVARLGGDEFCVIYPDLSEREIAEQVAQEIGETLTHRYKLEEAEFPLGASVGYAICPDDASTDKDLLAFADTAMFHAKEHRMGCASYEPEMTERLVEYRTVQERLALALDQDEFFLVYQPQVNLRTEKVIGVEALIRWRHDGEVIPPFRFIHLLERSREILPVSNWIIRQACKQLAEWNAAGYRVEISINVSALQFAEPEFYDSIAGPIQEFGVSPEQLDFEITEGLLVDDVSEAVDKLQEIKKLGVSISIDDFGTGYSSLAYLRQFPIDRLKIDRAFIKDIPNADDGVIASSIIVLAKALSMKVLAEGVETEAHLEFLKQHDCDEYQGYFLSPPVVPEEVTQYFEHCEQPV